MPPVAWRRKPGFSFPQRGFPRSGFLLFHPGRWGFVPLGPFGMMGPCWNLARNGGAGVSSAARTWVASNRPAGRVPRPWDGVFPWARWPIGRGGPGFGPAGGCCCPADGPRPAAQTGSATWTKAPASPSGWAAGWWCPELAEFVVVSGGPNPLGGSGAPPRVGTASVAVVFSGAAYPDPTGLRPLIGNRAASAWRAGGSPNLGGGTGPGNRARSVPGPTGWSGPRGDGFRRAGPWDKNRAWWKGGPCFAGRARLLATPRAGGVLGGPRSYGARSGLGTPHGWLNSLGGCGRSSLIGGLGFGWRGRRLVGAF